MSTISTNASSLPPPGKHEEDEFSSLDAPLDSAACADIDAVVAAKRARSPLNVGGHTLRTVLSPSKNCDLQALQMLAARHQKGTTSKASKSQHSRESSPTPESGAVNSRFTTPATSTSRLTTPVPALATSQLALGPALQGLSTDVAVAGPSGREKTPVLPSLSMQPWLGMYSPYRPQGTYPGYHLPFYPGYAYPPQGIAPQGIPPPSVTLPLAVPSVTPTGPAGPAPESVACHLGPPVTLSLHEFGPLQPLLPQPPPQKVSAPPKRSPAPCEEKSLSTSHDKTDTDLEEWQDLGEQDLSDNNTEDPDGSPKGKGGCPNQQFYRLLDKLVEQVNAEVLSIANQTGQKAEMVHRKLYGHLRGSNTWMDYAKYLKANLQQELSRLPDGTDYDSKCLFR